MRQYPPWQLPAVSVAVLSHRRRGALKRVLKNISRLDYPNFEVVVVGDQQDLSAYDLPEWIAAQIRYRRFEEPGICRARNHAIRAAAGEIVAFIDDDALPERNWLTELVKPFGDPMVATAGGMVLNGDGSGIEWFGGEFDLTARESPLKPVPERIVRSASEQVEPCRYLSIRGVNCAFRRPAVLQAGGFDEAIRYYLDETDLALRLAQAGWSTALTRRAEVRHRKLPNAARGRGGKPGSPYEIAASMAFFVNRYAGRNTPGILREFRNRRIAMLDPQMRLGIVRTTDRNRIALELDAGIADGLARTSLTPLKPEEPVEPFARFDRTLSPASIGVAAPHVANLPNQSLRSGV